MIKKIRVVPDSLASSIFFFREIDVEALPDPRIVPLFGPNGVGKSTLIRDIITYAHERRPQIEVEVSDAPMVMYTYENGKDNFARRLGTRYEESYNPYSVIMSKEAQTLSEGQSIVYSVFDLLDGLQPGEQMFGSEDEEPLVLLDEIDSGLSIDNIDSAMRKISQALAKRKNIQIFMSFNSPRVLKHFPHVISMYDGSAIELHSEDDMLAEFRKHKKEFNKARKKSDGRPKVFW